MNSQQAYEMLVSVCAYILVYTHDMRAWDHVADCKLAILMGDRRVAVDELHNEAVLSRWQYIHRLESQVTKGLPRP